MTRNRLTLVVALVGAAAMLTLGAPVAASGAPTPCPSSNRPNELVVVNGGTQTAQLGKPFLTNLQVALANTNGCPLTGALGGISVDFVAPAGGASGTFESTATNVAVVGTDSQGIATAPPFTANDTAGAYSVFAESDYGTVQLNVFNTARGVASSVVAAGLTEQSAPVLTRYAEPLHAGVVDAEGHGVQGVTVTFALGSGLYGAGATFLGGGAQATAVTDASGQATSPSFVANAVAGPFSATASADGVAEPISYALDNVAATNTLVAASASAQTATAGTEYAQPLQVTLLDAGGQPIEGATVTFALVQGANGAGGTFADGTSQATALTDATGLATSPALEANTTAGHFSATVASSGVTGPVRFSFRNLAGTPAAIVAGAAATESTMAGTRFPVRLGVKVTDANGNLVANAIVTFAAPAHGPGGRFGRHGRTVRVPTNAAGVAVAPSFTANAKPGGYVVIATVHGVKRPAAFALVNERR